MENNQRKNLLDLGNRERQIMEAVYRLGEASVGDVLRELDEPPSYSAVRTMLGILVQKNVLTFRHEGKKYLYRAVESKQKTQRSVLKIVLSNLFGGYAPDAVAALLDVAKDRISPEDFDRIEQMIEHAKNKENL